MPIAGEVTTGSAVKVVPVVTAGKNLINLVNINISTHSDPYRPKRDNNTFADVLSCMHITKRNRMATCAMQSMSLNRARSPS